MAEDTKKASASPAPKADSTPSDSGTKSTGGDSAAASYSRGEGQKPVTATYKENWNAIFGKKKKTRKK
jgi:hypothetical protein